MKRMLPTLSIVALVGILGTATIGWISSPIEQETGIQGAWIVTSEDDSHQRGLFIFTASNYSMMYVLGDEPRAPYAGDTPTEEEMLEAFQSFVTNSGRYSLEGNRLTYQAYMAKNPSYMADWPENDDWATVDVDGDTMTWTDSSGWVRVFRRVG